MLRLTTLPRLSHTLRPTSPAFSHPFQPAHRTYATPSEPPKPNGALPSIGTTHVRSIRLPDASPPSQSPATPIPTMPGSYTSPVDSTTTPLVPLPKVLTVASPSTHLDGGPILVSSTPLSSLPDAEEGGEGEWKPVERDLNEEEKRGVVVLAGIVLGGFVLGGLGKKSRTKA